MHKKACENKYFCSVVIFVLEFNQYQKFDKAPFIINAYLECWIEEIDECENNAEISSTAKISEHILSDFSVSTISSFKSIENKHDAYRGKDCTKTFCESLKEHAMEIISKRKKLKLLTKEQQISYKHAIKWLYL